MSAERPRTPPMLAVAVGARRALRTPGHLWRRSMRVRTMLITLLLSSIAMLVVGVFLSYTIGQGLFADQRDQVLSLSSRAVVDAQTSVQTVPSYDVTSLSTARFNAVALARTTGRADGVVWIDNSGVYDLPRGSSLLPRADLERSVSRTSGGQQWQSISIDDGGRVDPAIITGDVISFGNGQRAQIYLIYNLANVQDTLVVVQRALLVGGLTLLALIAAVVYVVAGLVTAPLKQAAATSEQLADGRLEQRIPERGEDVVATLARSFNRMAESMQRQITQLGNLSRVQQRFVSDVSHELRTPLTTIRLASDVLYGSRDRYDAPTARSAELLRTQVQRFEALLADLLEISRIDAQAADVAEEPTSLVDVARETIDSLGGLAEEVGSSVHLVAPGGHAPVDADARRIARIARNLLANALEHGEGRPVVVTVDSSETAVALGVRDHGVGMSEEEAERVFDRFWRADPSRRRRIGGTGLGLAISLEDAQLHGGTLEVWSRKGDGANFVLTLPRGEGLGDDRPVPLHPADLQSVRSREPVGEPVPVRS